MEAGTSVTPPPAATRSIAVTMRGTSSTTRNCTPWASQARTKSAYMPGYASIGIAAPLIVLLARILQGLSVGGEFATAASMLTEYAPPGRKMFYGSFTRAAPRSRIAMPS